MKINLSSIKDDFGASISFDFSVPVDQFSFEPNIPYVDCVSVQGKVVNQGSNWQVTGEITVPAKYTCDRCLKSFNKKEIISFIEEVPYSQEDDEAILIAQNERLDLTEYVRESLLLAQPIQVLCQEECRGLCPKCGVNRNEKSCTCDLNEGDLRLQVLKQLLDS